MIYGYVSSATGDEEQLVQQELRINSYCKRHGLTLDTFVGDCGSGMKIRKGLQLILNNITADDMLIVTDVSRLTRDIEKCMDLIKSIEDRGIELIVLKNGIVGFDVLQICKMIRRASNE